VSNIATVPKIEEGLIGFHSSWHDVNWDYWIRKAETSLDIVVFYWDKWTYDNMEALTDFLKKPDTRLRFFFTDDQDPKLLRRIQSLFPDHNRERIKQKIVKTTKSLEEYIEKSGLPPEKLEIRKIPHLLNYPFQIIDGRYVVISIFEMYRDKHVDAPAFIIDLDQCPEQAKFFQKEIHCLLHEKDHG